MALPPIVALEIGTTHVRVLVGEMRDDHQIVITGMGEAPSVGVRKGEITDMENIIEAVRFSLNMAETMAKVAIKEVHLAVAGGHIQSLIGRGSTGVGDGEVTREHVTEVMEIAGTTTLPPERQVLHTICQNFCIDDASSVINPEGMSASKLSLDMLIIHGVKNRIQNLVKAVHSVPMGVNDVAFSGLCAAFSVLTSAQKKGGAIVIDFGGGTTDYVAYAGDVMVSAGSLGVGGDHVTNDIAHAFNISTANAEQIKRGAGSALVAASLDGESVLVPEELGYPARTVKRKSLNTVINARMDETLGVIRKRLERERILPHIGAGVVLTGGGARLEGIADLAERVFERPCYVGLPHNISGIEMALEGPEHAVCSGMVLYGFRTLEEDLRRSGVGGWLRRMFGRDR